MGLLRLPCSGRRRGELSESRNRACASRRSSMRRISSDEAVLEAEQERDVFQALVRAEQLLKLDEAPVRKIYEIFPVLQLQAIELGVTVGCPCLLPEQLGLA